MTAIEKYVCITINKLIINEWTFPFMLQINHKNNTFIQIENAAIIKLFEINTHCIVFTIGNKEMASSTKRKSSWQKSKTNYHQIKRLLISPLGILLIHE